MSRKRKPEAERRRELIEAAMTVACRDGISGVTVRAVAAAAHVSPGLVLFHFGQRDQLVSELLDRLVEDAAMLRMSEDIARFPLAVDRLLALIQQEIDRVARHPEHARLFLEFWALGAVDERIRTRIRSELARYRAALLTTIEDLLSAGPVGTRGATATGLTALVLSWIQGCAIQALIDPAHFDTEDYVRAAHAVIGSLHGADRAVA